MVRDNWELSQIFAGQILDVDFERHLVSSICMRYLTRFCETSSDRIRSIVDMHWGGIRDWVHLIASACYPFPEAMKAMAEPMYVSPLEGLPGERFFPGTAVMDAVEIHAEELIRRLFSIGQEYRATIQPHSGTQANQVVFNAVLGPSDAALSLLPSEGGHISHKILIGRRNPVFFYPLGKDLRIDYEALAELARDKRPRLIIAGGSSYPREIDFVRIGSIARASGAMLHADVSHTATFIAAGVHSSVFPDADFVTFSMSKNLRGPSGGVLIYKQAHHRRIAKALFPETQGGPDENALFSKLVTLDRLLEMDLSEYANRMVQIARDMAEVIQRRGLRLVTNGTDSHILLVDLRSQNLTGVDAERLCERYRVLLNRNLIPDDPQKPWIASGVRLGTSCLTILGYCDEDVTRLANWIADRFTGEDTTNATVLIDELTAKYNTKLLPNPKAQ